MYRRKAFVTGLLVLSLFCGCLSGVPGSSSTETPPVDTSCGPLLYAERENPDNIDTADEIIDYSDLSNEEQTKFRKAIGGKAYIGEYDSDIWYVDIIRYNGTAYEPNVIAC